MTGGTAAYNALLGRLGLAGTNGTLDGYGTLGKAPTAADVMATPGYQFGLDQGQNQLQKQLNASGQSYSGAALKAAAQYGTDYGTTKYQQAFNNSQSADQQVYNQLAGTAGIGQASANNTAAAGAQYASTAGANLINAGDNAASTTLANGNAINSAINQGTSIYKNSSTPAQTGITPTFNYDQGSDGAGGYYSNEGRRAEGGPLVREPMIGSRTPLPGAGTGGGMSREALIQALLAGRPQTGPTGVGALPANPVMNPQAILQNRMQQAGAYAHGGEVQGPIHGPGGPRSDSIPVPMDNGQMGHLSNGEHVFQTSAVNAAGGGSNAKGQQRLNSLRAALTKGH